MHLDKNGKLGISNEVASYYGRKELQNFIEQNRKKGNILYEKKDLDSLPVNGRKLPPMAVESDHVFSILPRKNNVKAESQSYNWGIKKDVPVASWSARTNLLGVGAHSDTSNIINADLSISDNTDVVNSRHTNSMPLMSPIPKERLNKNDTRNIILKLRENIPDLEKMGPISKLSGEEFPKGKKRLTEQVGEFFKTLGNKVTRKGFGDVVIDENGIQDSIAYGLGRAKSVTFAAVPDIIKKGKQIDYQNQWKGRNYDTVVFAGPVEVANQKGFVAAVVIKKDTSNRYYLHEIVDSTGNIFKIKNGTEKAFKTGFIAENGAAGANSVPKISSGSDTDVPEFNQINEPVGSPSNHVQDAKPSAYNNIIEYGG